jgi:hypothetical protein
LKKTLFPKRGEIMPVHFDPNYIFGAPPPRTVAEHIRKSLNLREDDFDDREFSASTTS